MEYYLSSLKEGLKDDNAESLEHVIRNFSVKLEQIKQVKENLYFVLDIDELMNYVKKKMKFDYFKLILETIRFLNGLKDVQFKIILDEGQYKQYEEELLKEVKANLLNLSWNFINGEILINNIKTNS